MGLTNLFGIASLGDIGAITNPFGTPSEGQWNLSKGVYVTKDSPPKSIIFFYETRDPENSKRTAIDQITDQGGRRIAEYNYPYKDGVGLADLGRKGETFTFNIKFFGVNYQQKLQEFLDVVVNTSSGGTLTHPIRSSQKGIPVRFVDYEFVHRFDEWNAITIKAIFKEDQTDQILSTNSPAASQDTALRSALQALTQAQSTIQQAIFEVGALTRLPSAIINSLTQRLTSITNQGSILLGQLAATFSSDSSLHTLATQASQVVGGAAALSAGTTQLPTGGTSQQASLPPVYQVGFDPTTQAAITSQINEFISSNQITPQQALFSANSMRAAISTAIAEISANFGNQGYTILVNYRALANSMQTSVEASIATAQSLVVLYTVPNDMSLRTVAFLNGLSPDAQNDIEALNPYLSSVNIVPRGTVLTVPAA